MFNKIELNTWKRKEYFNHYLNDVPCTYSICVNLDVTRLISEIKKRNLKFFPTILFLITRTVNLFEEFRMSMDNENNVGYFDSVDPLYTVFNGDNESFFNVWTAYNPNFKLFYEDCVKDLNEYKGCKELYAKSINRNNFFTVSSLPWSSFTGFNLNLKKDFTYLAPILTIGKYFEQGEQVLLPLAIQCHHAVCDGFHVARFINTLQDFSNNSF